jgi:hypothetical protein
MFSVIARSHEYRLHGVMLFFLAMGIGLAVASPGTLLSLLPPNNWKLLTGLNCPFCGMTHDAISLLRGHASWQNPGSPVMLFFLLVIYPVKVVAAYRMKVPVTMRVDGRLVGVLLTVLLVLNNLSILRGRS